jgi:hypothetical protein
MAYVATRAYGSTVGVVATDRAYRAHGRNVWMPPPMGSKGSGAALLERRGVIGKQRVSEVAAGESGRRGLLLDGRFQV